ncbi:hypothetical protein JRQ81_020010 [Phrynocephalus forsythii]|uniref:Peptidase M12B propeptide domain-containing protein n=1 Tax=Phrynocephalus forsythii TaxID=171643 RepID=A0A9Q1AYI2_9SAUR|nr:hypothetical protein JRQ81_020010 [Phrynocephalus forsythii]
MGARPRVLSLAPACVHVCAVEVSLARCCFTLPTLARTPLPSSRRAWRPARAGRQASSKEVDGATASYAHSELKSWRGLSPRVPIKGSAGCPGSHIQGEPAEALAAARAPFALAHRPRTRLRAKGREAQVPPEFLRASHRGCKPARQLRAGERESGPAGTSRQESGEVWKPRPRARPRLPPLSLGSSRMKGAAALSLALSALGLCLAACGSPAPVHQHQPQPQLEEEEEALVLPVRLDPTSGQRRPPARKAGARLYSLGAFGEHLRLELQPDSGFLAPALTLQYVGNRPEDEQRDDEGASERPVGAALVKCFYSGTVNGDPGSAAALSLCGGLRGAFYLRGAEYLIQPANVSRPREGGGGGEEEKERLQLHVLRRRRRRSGARSPGGGAKCGVTDEGDPSTVEGERSSSGASRRSSSSSSSRHGTCSAQTVEVHGGKGLCQALVMWKPYL